MKEENTPTKEFIIESKKRLEEESNKISIFKKIKNKFNNLNKKQKILIIGGLIILIIGVIVLGCFLLKSKPKKESKPEVPKEVIIHDNYKYEDGFLIFIDENAKELGKYECTNKNASSCFMAYELDDDYFYHAKSMLEGSNEILKIRTSIYQKRYVFIVDDVNPESNVVALYDLENNTLIDKFLGVKSVMSDDSVILKTRENLYGMVELTETNLKDDIKAVIPFKYQYLGYKKENKETLIMKENNKYGIINFNNKVLINGINEIIKSYNDKYIVTGDKEGSVVSIINYKKEVIASGFNYIELLPNYYFGINGLNLRVYDYENNKMNEEVISLQNTFYDDTHIYDKDLKYVETINAYKYELINSTLTIEPQEGSNQVINLLEGKASSLYNYYSYFDGHLYIYEDMAKKELLGTYSCQAKNNLIDKGSSEGFNQCHLAFDSNENNNDMTPQDVNSNLWTPIINHRFVFIYDALAFNDNSLQIKLYDLKTSQVLGSYIKVNTYSNKSKTEHIIATSLEVVAVNKDFKYGLISVEANEVKGLIPFEYESLEKIGSLYLGKKNSKFILLDNKGNTQSSEFINSIRGFNKEYIKVLNGEKYYLYKNNGELVNENFFKYIELYDAFYAGVDTNNNLMIYDYENNAKLKNNVQLVNTNYYINPPFSWTCEFKQDVVIITVVQASEKTSTYKYNLKTGELLN